MSSSRFAALTVLITRVAHRLCGIGRALIGGAAHRRAIRERRHYRAAVDALPADQRQVFLLHRVDDLSIAEIARRLDLPTVEVEHLLARAILAIARALDAQA